MMYQQKGAYQPINDPTPNLEGGNDGTGQRVAGSQSSKAPKFGYQIPVVYQTLMVVFLISLFAITGYVSVLLVRSGSGCSGPPYLYVTQHDTHTIMRYTRDGCPLSGNVLAYVPGTLENDGEMLRITTLRSMVIHPYMGIKDALYVANAGENMGDVSRVLVFDTCNSLSGLRPFLKMLVDVKQTLGAQHTYAVTFDGDENMYTSFQYTDAVLRFSQKNGTFSPYGLSESQLRTNFYSDVSGTSEDILVRPLPGTIEYRRNYTFQDNYYKGTFVQFGWPGVHDPATQGIRGVVWIKRLKQLWIANEDTHRIVIVNEMGQYVGKLKVKNPIALYLPADVHDPKSPSYELVYVTSKKNPNKVTSDKQTGAVYGINMHTWQVNKTFTILGGQTMNHPTSVVAHEDVLFVAEQNNNVVLSFNVTSSRYIQQVFSLKSGTIEQLALSNC